MFSPSQQDLSHPLLDHDPIKKEWSWNTCTTTNVSSSDFSEGGYSTCSSLQGEMIELESESMDEEGSFVLALALEEGRVTDLDRAVLEERHQGIVEINSSLRALNSIQKDLAEIVQEQDADIEGLVSSTTESLDHASWGVSHLLAMKSKNRKANLSAAAFSLIFIVGFMHWILTTTKDDNGPPMP
jgi:hypothetical protein